MTSQEGNRVQDGELRPPAPSSGSLVVVLLVAVQLVGVVGGHVREILKDVLVGFVSCKKKQKKQKQTRSVRRQQEDGVT